MENEDRFQKALDEARKLVKLLEDPHPGLHTWMIAVGTQQERLDSTLNGQHSTDMLEYISEIRRQLRDVYKFKPRPGSSEHDPVFDHNVPDGVYPMTINGKVDRVRITNGQVSCYNF